MFNYLSPESELEPCNTRPFFFVNSPKVVFFKTVFFGVLIGFTSEHALPLLPVQILWINLVTDGLPSIALAFDPPARGIMQEMPRKKEEPLISWREGVSLFLIGAILGCATLVGAFFGFQRSIAHGQSMAFTGLYQLLLVWVIRWPLSLYVNRKLLGSVFLSLALQLAVLYVPFLQTVFHTVSLDLVEWGVLLMLGAASLFVSAIAFAQSKKRRGKRGG